MNSMVRLEWKLTSSVLTHRQKISFLSKTLKSDRQIVTNMSAGCGESSWYAFFEEGWHHLERSLIQTICQVFLATLTWKLAFTQNYFQAKGGKFICSLSHLIDIHDILVANVFSVWIITEGEGLIFGTKSVCHTLPATWLICIQIPPPLEMCDADIWQKWV